MSSDSILSSKSKISLKSTLSIDNNSLSNLLDNTIKNLTINYGTKINPFISGKYVIYMVNGPWYTNLKNLNDSLRIVKRRLKICLLS